MVLQLLDLPRTLLCQRSISHLIQASLEGDFVNCSSSESVYQTQNNNVISHQMVQRSTQIKQLSQKKDHNDAHHIQTTDENNRERKREDKDMNFKQSISLLLLALGLHWNCSCSTSIENRKCVKKADKGQNCTTDKGCKEGLSCQNKLCQPSSQAGQACRSDFTCSGELICQQNFSTNKHLCVTAPKEGEACIELGANGKKPKWCALGLGCDPDSKKCIKPPGAGKKCLKPDNLCAPGLGCQFRKDGTSICEPVTAGKGDKCTNVRECKPSLYCKFLGTNAGTCQPQVDDGGTCTEGGECKTGSECFPGQSKGDGRCRKIPTKAGENCFQTCGPSLFCDF